VESKRDWTLAVPTLFATVDEAEDGQADYEKEAVAKAEQPPVKRGRGRPKGSKNKPKVAAIGGEG
jgi:hypothetical protein